MFTIWKTRELRSRSNNNADGNFIECRSVFIIIHMLPVVAVHFSNSLIIHQDKTKEITTVKEVWIPGLN